ncbi:MAG: ExbD/TolR family protein [Verrucomicrobiales bacterium]|nr:biopolymer transporter ExbD [Verrucomicrobiota bacterium JB025]
MAASKLRNATAESEAECNMDMSPMIDMVFLLLIFFIVNATAIIVQTDPEIRPPVAKNSKPQEDGSGRIVVNVREDGTYTAEDFNTILPGDEEIYDYVKAAKERHESLGVKSKLHLRGDKETVFKHSRKAIRSSARAGVDQVVFAVFVREP